MKGFLDNLTLVYGISEVYPDGAKAFKQLQLQDIMVIPEQKPDVEQIISVSAKIEITKNYIIDTATGQSCEGQLLTGKKLVVEGKLHQKVEYVAELAEQPVHAAHFTLNFSTYIVLGTDISCYNKFDVVPYIEDIYVKQLNKRKIFKNVLILLNAVPLSKI